MRRDNVNAGMAWKALLAAGGDTKKAYSEYIRLHHASTGRLAPGCDNRDLQRFYGRHLPDIVFHALRLAYAFEAAGQTTFDLRMTPAMWEAVRSITKLVTGGGEHGGAS